MNLYIAPSRRQSTPNLETKPLWGLDEKPHTLRFSPSRGRLTTLLNAREYPVNGRKGRVLSFGLGGFGLSIGRGIGGNEDKGTRNSPTRFQIVLSFQPRETIIWVSRRPRSSYYLCNKARILARGVARAMHPRRRGVAPCTGCAIHGELG